MRPGEKAIVTGGRFAGFTGTVHRSNAQFRTVTIRDDRGRKVTTRHDRVRRVVE